MRNVCEVSRRALSTQRMTRTQVQRGASEVPVEAATDAEQVLGAHSDASRPVLPEVEGPLAVRSGC